jgi:hypothetical protein
MLTLLHPYSGARTPIAVAGGHLIGAGFAIPPNATPLTRARVLVVGDLVRRVLEDVHSAQVLAVVITTNHTAAEQAKWSGLMVRPVAGIFATAAEARTGLGKRLDLVVTVTRTQDESAPWPPTVAVAPINAAVPDPEPDPATLRFALAHANRTHELELTRSLLDRCQAVLDRWRDRVKQWSRYPSRPIPPPWRTAVIAAFDNDLDVARVVAMMSELEDTTDIEPGAKFEAFAYVDRVLAVDLVRNLART